MVLLYSQIGQTNVLNSFVIMLESRYSKRFHDHTKYTVSFGSNMSSVIMKFKLIIKKNTKVTL